MPRSRKPSTERTVRSPIHFSPSLPWAMEPTLLKKMASFACADPSAFFDMPDPQPAKVDPYQINGSTAIVPIIGPLLKYPNWYDAYCGCCFTLDVQQAIAKATDDNSIEQTILLIDTPGGAFAGTADLADFIARCKTKKPIIAYVSDNCMSGGYYLASQCTRIVASRNAFVGSIGVYCALIDESQAAAKAGYVVYLVSSGGVKGLGEPGLAIDPSLVAEAQRQVNSCRDLFCNAIAAGRNLPIDGVIQLADGRIHVAAEALGLGLIDAIGTLDEAITGTEEVNMPIATTANATVTPKAADKTEPAKTEPTSAPDDAVLKQILTSIQNLCEKIDAMAKAKEPAAADDTTSAAAERATLKAINEACPGHAEFAMTQFIAGKSPVEAKAALADLLATENKALRGKIAAGEDGIDPLKIAGNATTAAASNESDPEKIWEGNVNGVQEAFSGKKQYFLASFKHNKKTKAAK